MFRLATLKVVMHEGSKMFQINPVIETFDSVQTEKGTFHHKVWVNRFSSYNNLGREVDAFVIVYRKGEIFCSGFLCYLGGQSDGYLTLGGFNVPILYCAKPIEVCDSHTFNADAFEEGDEVVIVRRDK